MDELKICSNCRFETNECDYFPCKECSRMDDTKLIFRWESKNSNKFNLGDPVFWPRLGWGIVVDIEINAKNEQTNIILKFAGINQAIYPNGKMTEDAIAPEFFTVEEAKIKFPEYPLLKEKKKITRYINVLKAKGSLDGYEIETHPAEIMAVASYEHSKGLPFLKFVAIAIPVELEFED